MSKYIEKIELDRSFNLIELFGISDENLKFIKSNFLNTKIIFDDQYLILKGIEEEVKAVKILMRALIRELQNGNIIDKKMINYYKEIAINNPDIFHKSDDKKYLIKTFTKNIVAKTFGQEVYINSILKNDIVFGIGPAGTGKTYLAMAKAISGFKKKLYSRIILVRPAVEAGESLGFLPGDLKEKVDPYLRPLYDALYEMVTPEKAQKMIELGIVEVAPLAYMRGRTLNDAFVILDEAQNTTLQQMEMFLTRLGNNSKAIITGDITQIDLADKKRSGLVMIQKILDNIEGIEFVYLSKLDVLRHPLVQKIVQAFEKYQNNEKNSSFDKRENSLEVAKKN